MSKETVYDILKKARIEATEMFSAAVCNLDCSYCYIPKKDPRLAKYHKNIIEKITSDKFIRQLGETYGDNLTSIAHWGTEPTLTLNLYTENKFYEKLQKVCPNIEAISMSSNFMHNPLVIIDLIKSLPRYEKTIKLDVQMSLDGPDYITDKNRGVGSTKKITENIGIFFNELKKNENVLKEKNVVFYSHVKPTHYIDDIKLLMDMKYVLEYCDVFENLMEKILPYNSMGICISPVSDPTIVYPGRYTKEDGLNYKKYVENFFNLKNEKEYKYAIFHAPYMNYFIEVIKFVDHIFTGNGQSSCSAGRSQLAISDKNDLLFCHRMFYMNEPEVYDDLFNPFFDGNECYSGSEFGRHKLLQKFVADNMLKLVSTLAVSRGFNDYQGHKMNCTYALIKEMAKCGQISKIFLENETYCLLFTMFLLKRSCPVESIVTTGSIHLSPTSFYKIFGNGVFELICEKIFGRKI